MQNDNLSLSSHRSDATFWGSMLIFTGGRIYLASTGSSSSGEMEAQAGRCCFEVYRKLKEAIPFYEVKTNKLFQLGEQMLDLCMLRPHVKSAMLKISDTGNWGFWRVVKLWRRETTCSGALHPYHHADEYQ